MADNTMNWKFDSLNHDNYSAWSYRCQLVLEREETWEVITGSRPEAAADLVIWNKKDNKAKSTIALHVEDAQLVHIKKCTTARQCWEALKANNRHASLGSRVRIMKNLFNEKLAYGGNMKEHLTKMLDWMDKLREQDAPLDDDVAVGTILASLNKQYDNVITGIEAWDDERLTLQAVKAKLIEEWEKRRHVEPQKQSSQEKFMSSGRLGNPVGKDATQVMQSSSESFLCHNCGQPGHFRRNCPRLRFNVKEKENKTNEESAKLARFSEWYTAMLINESCINEWVIDSGATSHMCGNRDLFYSLKESKYGQVTVANGMKTPAMGSGSIRLKVNTDEGSLKVLLNNVLWVPHLKGNLISVNQLGRKGFTVMFTSDKCKLSDGNKWQSIGKHRGGLYILNNIGESFLSDSQSKESAKICIHEWHKRLGHRNLADIREMHKEGLKIAPCQHSDDCEACIKGKMARKPFKKSETEFKNPIECIVSDVCGPLQVASFGKKKYFVTYTDMFSRYTEVRFIREKSEVPNVTIEFLERLKTQFGKSPKVFRSDRGTEYLNKTLQDYLRRNGIQAQFTVGYAPEQNGVAERKNRTLMEATRTMLIASGMAKGFWAEALSTANYVMNRIINKKKGKTPYDLFYGKKPQRRLFHEFGCEAYVMVPSEKRRKLDDKAVKMRFLGYDENAKGFRLANANNKVIVSREVRFLTEQVCEKKTDPSTNEFQFDESLQEEENSKEENSKEENSKEENSNEENSKEENGISLQEEENLTDEEYESLDDTLQEEENSREENEPAQEEQENTRHSTRSNFGKTPARLNDYQIYRTETHHDDPKTFVQAMSTPEKEEWLEAMVEELNTIEDNNTWDLVELPYGRKAIGSKWVFKTKRDNNGIVARRKARLVAQGFSQKYGIDYDEVFAPVARSATFRMLLSIAGKRNYFLNQYDIKAAFLNGKLNEEVYMKQPPGFQESNKVYRLKKSLYGLKQAARVWNQTMHETLENFGFQQSLDDKCLYKKQERDKVCFLIIHVDDILVATNDTGVLSSLERHISQHFEIKNLGGAKQFLGIDIERQDGKFFISQQAYIDSIVQEAKLTDAKFSKTPLDVAYFKKKGTPLGDNNEYRKFIGMLLYAATNTRPDISASVAILSKKVQNPTDHDMNEVKRVIRYLSGSRELKLLMNETSGEEEFHAFSDANWAEDPLDRKSTSGNCCIMNGGTISWWSRKQSVIALSSCESEYVALTETCKEVIWLKEIAKFFNVNLPVTTTVYTDSQSCIAIVENQKHSNRTKHIDTKYQFIRNEVEAGRIKLKYVPSEKNTADLMTKPIGATRIEQLRKMAGLQLIATQSKSRRSVELKSFNEY